MTMKYKANFYEKFETIIVSKNEPFLFYFSFAIKKLTCPFLGVPNIPTSRNTAPKPKEAPTNESGERDTLPFTFLRLMGSVLVKRFIRAMRLTKRPHTQVKTCSVPFPFGVNS